MPTITFSTDHVKANATSFPRVKLENKGDTWRIVCAEPGPTYEWVHQLRKPKVSPINGEPIMVQKERRNGEKYEDHDYEFVGNPLCLGDPEVLDEKGVDPDHCPVCAKAISASDFFAAPERRFAVHVLKYATKGNTSQVASPFSVETRVWVLSENRFAKVAQIITEWGGDARKVDLILGPCNNVGFQNYEIQAGSKCEMLASQDRLERAVETFKENHAPDLAAFCGRKVDKKFVEQDIEDVEARWNAIRRGGFTPTELDTSGTLDSSLLDTEPAAAPAAAAPPAAAPTEEVSVSGLDEFAPGTTSNPGPGSPPAAEPAASEPVAETPAEPSEAVPEPAAQPAAPAAVTSGSPSFEDLLGQLGAG